MSAFQIVGQDAGGNHRYFNGLLMNLRSTAVDSMRVKYNLYRYANKWYIDHLIDAINEKYKSALMAQSMFPLKAIIAEVGAPSNHFVHGAWGETFGLEVDLPQIRTIQVDKGWGSPWPRYATEQAKGWGGYLRSFRGDPRIVGVSLWGIEPHRARADTNPIDHWLQGYDFNGKLADGGQKLTEEEICKWFKRSPPTPCYAP